MFISVKFSLKIQEYGKKFSLKTVTCQLCVAEINPWVEPLNLEYLGPFSMLAIDSMCEHKH